jgi:hypothetical protein
MKSLTPPFHLKKVLLLTFICFVQITLARCNSPINDTISNEKAYYAIEINNVLCGYSEASQKNVLKDGHNIIEQKLNIFIMLSVLGSEFNSEMKVKSYLDPETRKCVYIKGDIKQGAVNREFEVIVEGNNATITSSLSSQPIELELSAGVLSGNDEIFIRLKEDILNQNIDEVTYDILEAIEGEIQTSTFRKLREEGLELEGKNFKTTVIEQKNNKTGVKITYWLSPEYDYFVKTEVMNRKIYLTDHTVVDKIKVANMNESILTKTNVISDIPSITYMKLKAEIEPSGKKLTVNDLNVPGQKFTGTVEDNHINGIFEIAYERYDGINAPPFPPNFNNESLKGYLQPDIAIESDDSVLVAKAKEITGDSKDSWEAAIRLSKWVAENINYAIPGGGTAKKTYEIRAGECGSHSFLLAAFCRAVGIPSRVVWGAMYAPNFGGGFGQHGWNEIYMGENGWIPVDATAFETDFVDAGHIRICEYESVASTFNGKSIEILDYKLATNDVNTPKVNAEKFAAFIGKYKNDKNGKIFEVLEKDGSLSVDIPGQMILPFNQADEEDRWYCKLSPRLYITFNNDKDGIISEMMFHEIVSMTRKSDPKEIEEDIPEKYKPYLGGYLFAAVNAEFTVSYDDNTLSIYDPLEKETVKLQPPDEYGRWLDEYNKNTIYFDFDNDGKVTTLNVDASNKFERVE